MSGSRIEVLTPAASLDLLTVSELRAAAGLAADDASQDAHLAALGLEAAEWIAGDVCGIRTAGANPPTVLAEEIRETFPALWLGPELVLARRFVSDVTVTENGAALADGDFVVLDDRGVIQRMSTGYGLSWQAAPIVVEYTAGFSNGSPSNVPAAIKAVARDYVRMRHTLGSLDPTVKSERTDDLDSVTYWGAGESRANLEDDARQRLARFICFGFA